VWKERRNPAKAHVLSDWRKAADLGMDALYALSPVKNPLESAWVGSTPARDAFVAGLEDKQQTIVRVWESVRDELWDTYSSEPERIDVWIPG